VEGRIAEEEDAIHCLICGPSAHLIQAQTMMRLLKAALLPCMKTTPIWGIQDGLLTRVLICCKHNMLSLSKWIMVPPFIVDLLSWSEWFENWVLEVTSVESVVWKVIEDHSCFRWNFYCKWLFSILLLITCAYNTLFIILVVPDGGTESP